MDAISEFEAYFKSGNDVPVTRAVIPAELAHRLIADYYSLIGEEAPIWIAPEERQRIQKQKNEFYKNLVESLTSKKVPI